MGRPLNKKYFGNRNTGSASTTADNAIGGEGIASINWSTLGAFQGNSNVAVLTVPALPAPTLPNGVQATWAVLFDVESVFTGSGKTDLAVGDTFGVASVPGLVAKVTDVSGTNAVFSVTTTGASRGTPLAVGSIPQDTVGITLTKIAGTGTAATFLCDITFRVASVTITEQGSGYTGAETFTFTKPGTTSGDVPAGTITLTTESGNVGSATYEENAIRMTAYLTGGSATDVDIIRQVSTTRYKVTDGTRTGIIALTSTLADAAGEGSILATDAAGGTYYVTKLTAHKATLKRGTGTVYVDGAATPWTFGTATATVCKIANA